jgi:glutamine synthetase
MRLVTGSAGNEARAANIEIKCFDLLANPYLVLSGLLAAGVAGIADEARLPEPVDVDPAALGDEVLAERGIARLPTSLRAALDAFRSDDVLISAFGPALVASIAAIRESELELFDGASDDELAAATRWAH